MMKKLLGVVALLGVCAVGFVKPVQAATTLNQGTYILEADKTIQDTLYISGADITIEGVIKGDLVAAASKKIVIKGEVQGSVLAASPEIVIEGTVGQSVRVLHGELTVTGKIGGDITSIGESMILKKEAMLADSVFYLGDTAKIEASIPGQIQKWLASEQPQPSKRDRVFEWVFAFLALGLLGAVVYIVQPIKVTHDLLARQKEKFIANLGIGILLVFIAPLLGLLILATGVGGWLGLMIILLILIIALLATVDACYVVGSFLFSFLNKGTSKNHEAIIPFLLGALVVTALNRLPGVGIIPFVLVVAAMGARFVHLRSILKA